MYLSKFKWLRRIQRKTHRGPQRYGSIGPSIGIVMGVFNLFYICNTRSHRFVPSWPTMCFSSYSLEPFELRQILHSRIRRRKGTKPTWSRQHIHYSDKNQDPILFPKPPVHARDKTNHQTCCYTVSLDCIMVQASYPLRTSGY